VKAAIIIPARFASSRLPGKPLLSQTGKTLIQHTYERALLAHKASQVIVATDDQRIFDVVEHFGGEVVMTAQDHETGSARAAEVAAILMQRSLSICRGMNQKLIQRILTF